MFISQQTLETAFLAMKEASPSPKMGMERTTSVFRFLAFNMLCREEGEAMLDFSPENSDMRNRLIEKYDEIAKVGKDSEVCNLGSVVTPGRFGAARIGNDFLTAQLKQGSERRGSDGVPYPSRPAPILQIACGAGHWGVKRHFEWKSNLRRFLEGRSSKPFTNLVIYLLRSFDLGDVNGRTAMQVIDEGIGLLFPADVAAFLNERIESENASIGGLLCEFQVNEPSLEHLAVSSLNEPGGVGLRAIAEESSTSLSLENLAFHFDASTEECGLNVEHSLVVRFASCLLAKRFLIATGLSGAGKTKLAQAFARWLAPSDDFYRVVSVGADWTGNENVLGYPNGLDLASYVSKPALDLVIHAREEPEIPHFLILDEMNLSHVERYFADILSAIESDEGFELYSGDLLKPETWRRTMGGVAVPPRIERLPTNLFIIGTVNVDETTYMFSPKVLDRASVIEFRMDAGELATFLGNSVKPDLSKIVGKGAAFGKAFVESAQGPVAIPADVKEAFNVEMLLLFQTLHLHGAEFGYRTAYETARFVHFYKRLGNCADIPAGAFAGWTWLDDAFDCVIFQKFLPKLHGSRAKLGPVLKKLWFLCVNNSGGRGEDALTAAGISLAEPNINDIPENAPYRMSAEKICRMWRLMMENGFASFAEA
jgi:5-methylcytosine-specific restriction protein B